MQAKAKLYELEVFGENDTKKATFVDLDTMDKVAVLLSDEKFAELKSNQGKDGILTIGLEAKGYNYQARFKSFKTAA